MKTSTASIKVASLVGSLLLTGCVAGPNFSTPKTPDTPKYTTESLPTLALPAEGTSGAMPEMWWSLFQSPKLDETVRTALAGNHGLQAAQATLAQANELLGVARAARMPEVSGDAGVGRQKLG